jgi:hypothetical protein
LYLHKKRDDIADHKCSPYNLRSDAGVFTTDADTDHSPVEYVIIGQESGGGENDEEVHDNIHSKTVAQAWPTDEDADKKPEPYDCGTFSQFIREHRPGHTEGSDWKT